MIVLPFPPASLSGHNKGHWAAKARIVATHRAWAFHATRAAKVVAPEDGEVAITIRFVPPHNRGDRVNYPNRMKPYIDGIAEALGINDRRFLPSYEFLPPEKPGRVEVCFPHAGENFAAEESFPESRDSATKRTGGAALPTPSPPFDINASSERDA